MYEIIYMIPGQHEQHVRELFWNYLCWANHRGKEAYGLDLDIKAMLEQNMAELHKFSPPEGRLFLAQQDDEIAGCGCLRKSTEGTAEIKRMYVRPEHRGKGLGRHLLEALILEARKAGYARIRLDSARFMTEAQALYAAYGFEPIAPYPESEIPAEFHEYMVFMELDLRRSSIGNQVKQR